MRKRQTSIAIVNDISGFGRCSVTVALPILSAMKIQCGVVPTAILSNQTEYPSYTMLDFTDHMEKYISNWKKLNFSFDGLYTGFLGSEKQIDIINHMIHTFQFEHIIIDPVMGDHGRLYDSYTKEMCRHMKNLIKNATVITPNVTELCLLTDHPYSKNLTTDNIKGMCQELSKYNIDNIIVTGIENDGLVGNATYNNGKFYIKYQEKIHPMRPGTGDVFASVIAGCILKGIPLLDATDIATEYVRDCLISSVEYDIPINDGVCFEEHLNKLISL